MSIRSSTFRSMADQTMGLHTKCQDGLALEQLIATEWQGPGEHDLVGAIRRHPQLLEKRSLLLNLAINEFRAHRAAEGRVDLGPYCGRFRQFGTSIERSILRQLETQQYIDDHPNLLGLLDEPKWPAIGEPFLNFDILEELGRGGAARVYLCREAEIGNRLVVLKVTAFCDLEASILGRLNHPNIIPVFSTGVAEEENLQYLCMPYRGRSTLADLIDVAFQDGVPQDDRALAAAARRWLPASEAIALPSNVWASRRFRDSSYVGRVAAIGMKLADALDHAHQQGILHGDLKPSNVLLTSEGAVLLLDFNLSQDSQARFAVCGGTLSYMPPEHLRFVAVNQSSESAPPSFDARTDVYSFGALLYELLAGRAPVQLRRDAEDAPAAARALLVQLRSGIVPPQVHNRMISAHLDSLIMRCLALELDDRPASMAEVRESLARELKLAPSIGRHVRRRPLLSAALCSATLGVAIIAGAYVVNRPPRYLAYYHDGLECAKSGQPAEAIEYFNASLEREPDFREAQFQRAVARIKLGDIDLAMSDFRQLAQAENDPASMAYMGYCYNLKEIPAAAIEWYEQAIDHGAESGAIFNNLGASYLAAPGRHSNSDRYKRADECISRASQLLSASNAVSLNMIRMETSKLAMKAQNNVSRTWQHAEALLESNPGDPLVSHLVAQWYSTVVNSATFKQLPGNQELARDRFEVLISYVPPPHVPTSLVSDSIAYPRSFSPIDASAVNRRFYIEPIFAHGSPLRRYQE